MILPIMHRQKRKKNSQKLNEIVTEVQETKQNEEHGEATLSKRVSLRTLKKENKRRNGMKTNLIRRKSNPDLVLVHSTRLVNTELMIPSFI